LNRRFGWKADVAGQLTALRPRESSRAAFRNSQADPSHSATKNPVRNTIASGQLAPVEPNPAIRAITPTNA
jgi:hypothetical protein